MFDLNDYLPYLLNRTGLRIASAFSRELGRFDLNLQMWRVLAALWHEGDQRMGRLAEITSIDGSTLSRLVGAMQAKGLVERDRSDADARIVSVSATVNGRALTERLIPLALATEHKALAGLSQAEIAALKLTLQRVFDNVD